MKEIKKLIGQELTIEDILNILRSNGYDTDMEDVISQCESGFVFISEDAEDYDDESFRITYSVIKNEDDEFGTDSVVKVTGIE